ncbi:winged helix-turn-helix transcriptional regulator [Octadecabacter sp. R77987]|uniref:winged helix-turn-helix transcriptional regulator n=1 Tax=Octadecabacter sp. R77987 TaxID=3093874 RepID=UPI00367249CE
MSNPDGADSIRRTAPVPLDQCGAALASEILSDRWTLLILREALYGVKRYDDIRADTGIPRSVLTDRLKRLVGAGILLREPYREAGARTRYAYGLTPKGAELGLTILALMQWGDRHIKGGKSALRVQHRTTGRPLKVALVEANTDSLGIDAVTLVPTDAPRALEAPHRDH